MVIILCILLGISMYFVRYGNYSMYFVRYGNLLPQEGEEIGRRCKQLIDRGRVNYLIEHGYKTEQICYTDREHTLENMALIATCR